VASDSEARAHGRKVRTPTSCFAAGYE